MNLLQMKQVSPSLFDTVKEPLLRLRFHLLRMLAFGTFLASLQLVSEVYDLCSFCGFDRYVLGCV